MNPRAWLAIWLVASGPIAGCVTVYGDEGVHARVLVTRDVGTDVLTDANVTVQEGATVLDALRETANVSTEYGGGFVAAIDGLESRYPDHHVDWFYHVNTTLAEVGAGQRTVAESDVIVWDYRPWNRTLALQHVLTGLEAWPEERSFEREAFVDRQRSEAAKQLYARVNGSTLTVLDAWGEPARTVEAPWLLAHAVDTQSKQPAVWLVASGSQGRQLADGLTATEPGGIGRVLTPDGSFEVPAS